MIFQQFQATADSFGNLVVAGGWVLQPRQGVALPVAGTTVALGEQNTKHGQWLAMPAQGATFVGGSGNNVVISAVAGGLSGIYAPLTGGRWVQTDGPGEIQISYGTASLSDGVDVVATATVGGWQPVGTFYSTGYGEDTYNGSASFEAYGTAEDAGNGFPMLTVSIPTGLSEAITVYLYNTEVLIMGGSEWISTTIVPGEAQLWTVRGSEPGAWMEDSFDVIINPDGTADFNYSGTAMATRAAGSLTDPSGVYVATEAGKTDWNGGDPWQAFITCGRVAPRAGWAYLEIEDVAGVLTSVAGPFFATSLPTHSGDFYYYPLAYCSGSPAPEQVHLGAVQWGHTTGTNGTDGTGLAWVVLSEAAYNALGTPDADTIYDVLLP